MWRRLICLAAIACWGCDSDSPTAPDPRTGIIALRIVCDDSGARPLQCLAQTYCAGLYRCPDPAADGADVTTRAEWAVEHEQVARLVAPGRLEAVGTGYTVLSARYPSMFAEARRAIGVFPGTAALPVNEIFGNVTVAGATPQVEIAGAVIEATTGLIAGRTEISGTPPTLIPGFVGPFGGPGYFRFLGVPPGSYELTIGADGYLPQTRTVTVLGAGSPSANFALTRQ